jgi:hypothetical protein
MTAPGARIIRCDARGLLGTDLGTLEALARLALEARRAGFELRLDEVPRELDELIAIAGLEGVLLGGEARGEPEQREQALGVQEEGQLDGGAA